MTHLLEQRPCPRCRAKGDDTRGDNLAVYDDGHKWCFACGLYIPPPDTIEAVKAKLDMKENDGVEHPRTCDPLPSDITSDLDVRAKRWLLSYELMTHETSKFWWSPSKEQLIYPIKNADGYIIAWQGRDFSKNAKSKYYSSGDMKNHFEITDTIGSTPLIIVEDIVSAIKVGRQYKSLCLFGSHLSRENMVRLRDFILPAINKFYMDRIIFWLDSDKKQETLKYVKEAQELGFNAGCRMTTADPKAYSTDFIKKVIQDGMG